MTRTIARCAAVALLAGGLHASLATPALAQVSGVVCGHTTIGWNSTTDFAEIEGGPVVADEPGASIWLTCSIQAGEGNSTHAGPDAASVRSEKTVQVAVLPPTPVFFARSNVTYLCTAVWIRGANYYWDAANRVWSTSDGVACSRSGPPGNSLIELLNEAVFQPYVDPLTCDLIGALAPGMPGVVEIDPTGDVYVLNESSPTWDCPPYVTS